MDTAFGDMAYKAEEFADTAIDRFGMSALSAKKTASNYMAMAKSLGLSAERASDMAISLAGLSGDVASFYNISQETADTKLKSVFTGETETLKELGVVMTQANLDAFAMANGFGKTTAKMTQAEKVQLRYAYVTRQLAMTQGDFAKTSGSWANQTRILTERWNEFKSVIGQLLIRVLTPALQTLNQLVSALSAFAKKTAEAFGVNSSSATDSAAGLAAAAADLSDGFSSAAFSAEKLKRATAGFDEMNILSSGSSSGTFGTSGASGMQGASSTSGAGNKAEKAGKWTGVFDAMKSKFAPATEAWSKAFERLRGAAEGTFGGIKTAAADLWSTLTSVGGYVVGQFVPNMVNAFSETFAPIFSDELAFVMKQFGENFSFMCSIVDRLTRDIFLPCMELIRKISSDMGASVKSTWTDVGGTILGKASEMAAGLREIWNSIYDRVIKPVVERVAEVLNWLWDNHLKKLWDDTIKFFASVADFVLTVWNRVIKPFVDYLVAYLAPIVTSVINTIVDVVGTVVAVVSDVIGGVFEVLGGILDFITGVFSGDWKKAWSGIQKYFSGIWNGMVGIVKGVVNLIIDVLNALWRALYSAVAGVVNGVGSVVKTIGKLLGKEWDFKMPSQPPVIPKLAEGGIATRATNAVIGEAGREAVLPLENNTEWMDQLADRIAQRNRPAGTLVLKVGERELGRIALDAINSHTRETGTLGLVMV